MYNLQSLNPGQVQQLSMLPIRKQGEIKAKFGKPLDLLRAYNLVKETSNGFTEPDETASRLDGLMWQLMQAKGFFPVTNVVSTPASTTEMPGESEISGTTEELSIALAGLQTALKYETPGTPDYDALADAIAGLEVAIKYN